MRFCPLGNLHIQASEIRAPRADYFSSSSSGPLTTPQVRSLSSQYAGYPGFLLAVGCFVFAMTLAALIYLLIVWARSVKLRLIISNHNLNTFFRYRHAKDRAQRMVVIPRYEPVFVEPNLKQYEV